MAAFTISGIYLWYKLTQRYLLGYVLLTASFAFALAMVLYLMYAP